MSQFLSFYVSIVNLAVDDDARMELESSSHSPVTVVEEDRVVSLDVLVLE